MIRGGCPDSQTFPNFPLPLTAPFSLIPWMHL